MKQRILSLLLAAVLLLQLVPAELITPVLAAEGITRLEQSFAYGCTNLTTLVLPDTLEYIGMEVTSYSGLLELRIPAGVQTLETSAFANSALETVEFAGTLDEIPDNCFSFCEELSSVTLPEGLLVIGSNAFQCCESLSHIEFPDSLLSINAVAFHGCGLKYVVFPERFWNLATGAACFDGLEAAYFKGPGINMDQSEWARSKNCQIFGDPAEDFAIYIVEGQPDWTDLPYEGCSADTWYTYPLRYWDGKNVNTVQVRNTVDEYYQLGTERFFEIVVPGHTSYPLPGEFTVTVGEQTYVTDGTKITIDIPADNPYDVVFSKEGYISFTMLAELVSKFNWVTMWKDDGSFAPIREAICLRQDQ